MNKSGNRLDVSKHLSDSLMVATGCSWRRIIGQSGRKVCVPCNHPSDNHPDLEGSMEDLTLLSAAPELYESTAMLIDALESILQNKSVKCLDETIKFAEMALAKAENNS